MDELLLTLTDPADLSGQIYRQIRTAIADGRVMAGARLPSTREVAASLEVSRNTVAAAYERLVAEGFLTGRVGAGTYVSAEVEPTARPRRAPVGELRPRAVWDRIDWSAPSLATTPEYDFRIGLPDTGLVPFDSWRRLVTEQLRASQMPVASYTDPTGDAALREVIARYIGATRMVQASPDDVIVTNGAQQALDLAGRVLIEPGSTVAVEDPGYPAARALFRSLGANVVPVTVDAEGLDVAALPADTRVVYVTPSHQFPLGVRMSLARRMALLDWARSRQAAVIEDDYDSEFRYGGQPLEPLQTLDSDGRVLYVGTFSKTLLLLPGLRLGYMVAPSGLRRALRLAKLTTDWHAPAVNQMALARFIEEGLMARHVRKVRRIYAARRSALDSALRTHAASWLEPIRSAAGLHLAAWLRDAAVNPDDVINAAERRGIACATMSRYAMRDTRHGLVLGYGAISIDRIDEGVRLLAACFTDLAGRQQT